MKAIGYCVMFCLLSSLGYGQQGSTLSPEDSSLRFRHSIQEFESEIFGKRNVFTSNSDIETIEISADGMNLRTINESRYGKGQSLVDFQGHYVSVGLGQAVSVSNWDSRKSKESIKLEAFGVTFFKAKSTVVAVKGLFGDLRYGVVRGVRVSDFFDESVRIDLPAKGGSKGAFCKLPSGLKAEIWLNEEGRFRGVSVDISQGDILENGEQCPAGQWSKMEYKVEWSKDPQRKLASIRNSVEANGGINGSRLYTVIESKAMEKPLGSH